MTDPYAWENPGLEAEIGFGRVDITPQDGAPINNWAAGQSRRSSGNHLPLTGTAMYLEHPTGRLVLISLDLGWWRTDDVVETLRQRASLRLGLPEACVAICLTHTHAGPAVDPVAVGAAEAADVRSYVESLGASVERMVDDARSAAVPGRLEWRRGQCGLARVRDQWSPAEARYLCGFAPDSQADQTLMVGRVADLAGRTVGTIVNYGCHPTSLGPENTLLSPDYVGAARDLVERSTGSPMLFLQGASGELAPRRQYEADPAAAEANGEELGHAVLSTIAGMLPPGTKLEARPTVESGAPLGRWSPSRKEPDGESVAAADTTVRLPQNRDVGEWRPTPQLSPAAAEERRARQDMVAGGEGGDQELPVTVWRLGPAVLVATPGEAYSNLQTELRERFPERPVIVVNLANGRHRGYLPPAAAYDSQRYQVWQTPLGRGSLETVVQHCAHQISLLTRTRVGQTTEVGS